MFIILVIIIKYVKFEYIILDFFIVERPLIVKANQSVIIT